MYRVDISASVLHLMPHVEKSLYLCDFKNYREGATGGKTAAPVTANIYRRIFPILGITKNYNLDPELLVENKGELNFVSY